jgi:uncharacterized protein YkwD
MTRIVFQLCAQLLIGCAVSVAPAIPSGVEGKKPDLNEVAKAIVEGTNVFRKEKNLQLLASDESLSATARDFAKFIADTGKYGHQADGLQPYQRAERHGYEYCVVLENLAYKYNSEGVTREELISFFVESWKDSPNHRKNMLDPDVTQTGVGIMNRGKGYYCAVQMFGRPKSAMIKFEIANKTDIPLEYTLDDKKYTLMPQRIHDQETCRDPAITLQPPGEKDLQKVRPANGDRFEYRRIRKGVYGLIRVEK